MVHDDAQTGDGQTHGDVDGGSGGGPNPRWW